MTPDPQWPHERSLAAVRDYMGDITVFRTVELSAATHTANLAALIRRLDPDDPANAGPGGAGGEAPGAPGYPPRRSSRDWSTVRHLLRDFARENSQVNDIARRRMLGGLAAHLYTVHYGSDPAGTLTERETGTGEHDNIVDIAGLDDLNAELYEWLETEHDGIPGGSNREWLQSNGFTQMELLPTEP